MHGHAYGYTHVNMNGHPTRTCLYLASAPQLPLFLDTALHASATTRAAGTILPYVANVVLATAAGSLADHVISSGRVSRTHVRKAFTALGVGGAGVLLCAAGAASQAKVAVALVIGANGVLGLAQARALTISIPRANVIPRMPRDLSVICHGLHSPYLSIVHMRSVAVAEHLHTHACTCAMPLGMLAGGLAEPLPRRLR